MLVFLTFAFNLKYFCANILPSNDPTHHHPTQRPGKPTIMEVETISPGNWTHDRDTLCSNKALSSNINSLAWTPGEDWPLRDPENLNHLYPYSLY